MAEDHDDRQHRGGHQVAGRPGADQGKGDQPVGDAVQAGVAQAVPGGGHNRQADQDGRTASHQARQRRLGRERPGPEQGQHEQAGREHGQGQAQGEQEFFRPRQQAGAQRHGQGRRGLAQDGGAQLIVPQAGSAG